MRYFLVTFNLEGLASLGNILIELPTFPSKTYIQKLVHSYIIERKEVIIVTIFEFKNETDYKSFEK